MKLDRPNTMKPLPNIEMLKEIWTLENVKDIFALTDKFVFNLADGIDRVDFIRQASEHIEKVGGFTKDFYLHFTQGGDEIVAVIYFQPNKKVHYTIN